jgi:thymidylate kinase
MNSRPDKEYNRGAKKDIHEEDRVYQDNVRATYLEQANDGNWIVIQCAEKNGSSWNIKSIDKIHSEIMERVKPLL